MLKRPTLQQLTAYLQSIPLFAALDDATLNELAASTVWRRYDAGETVFWEGDPGGGLHYLQSGWLKVVKSAPSGREQVIKFLGPGETFNEIGALANRPNPATAVALEPASILLVPQEALAQLIQARPRLAQHLIEGLAERVLHLVSLVTDLSLRSVTGRLAQLLLENTVEGVVHRPRWYTQAELASRLGTVPDVVQRALRRLADEDLISVERHQITVLNREALARIAAE